MLILLACSFCLAQAQDLSRMRFKTFPVSSDTLQLDSLSIVAGSLIIRDKQNNLIDTSAYHPDPVKGYIVWKQKPLVDSITAIYRSFPFSFSRSVFNKDAARLNQTEDFIANPFEYIPSRESSGFVDFGTLDYNGSFARGISFGNNQDVVLNSSFNLQLTGNITKDIEVVAALTDNNIPIQPDGTTQQLQEFDKVFIKVTKQPHSFIVGDYEIGNPKGYFMKYFKKLQGGSYSGNFKLSEKEKVTAQASIAVTKGKYNRQRLPVSEGDQGPYKLTGANGESFIIVLAGTERVYINGKLLLRGSENDYIIDYNIGEITFTPNVLITSDLRAEVEFEYSEKSYFRSTFAVNGAYEREKVKIRAAFYTEQDSKNQPVDEDLTDQQKGALRLAGDHSTGILFPGYSVEEFDSTKILYKLIDGDSATAEIDTVFVYSTNPDSAIYQVTFTHAGKGLGDYERAPLSANGVVYEWLAPVSGARQGSYIPFRVLIAPNRQQMVTLGMDLSPTKNDFITVEGAMSNNDLNTFSSVDDDDDIGFAAKAGYQRKFAIGAESKKQNISADANYEFVNHDFNPLERFRSVEFNRDWNYANPDTADEHLLNVGAKYLREEFGSIGYRLSTFLSGDNYTGVEHHAFTTFDRNGYFLNADLRFLNTDATNSKSKFIRPVVEASKSFAALRNWKFGGRYEQEINKLRNAATDTLLSTGFVYNDWRVYISNADTARDKVRMEYIRRFEFKPMNNDMKLNNNSNTVSFKGNWITNPVHKIGWQLTYRNFETNDSAASATATELEHYYLGRIEYGLMVLKGAITTNVLYELGAGKEPKIQYTYLPVDTGLGNFIWNDYNGNSKQETFEFEPAPFSDAGDFIRVLNPTTEFEAVDKTQYNQSLNLNPRAVWHGKTGIQGFIARFSTATSLQIERRVFRGSGKSPFNPFVLNENDGSLVSLSSLARNSVFFNRQSAKYSLEYTFQDNRRKINQVNGIETATIQNHIGRIRWNVAQPVSLLLTYTWGQKTSNSEFYNDKNYHIKSNETEPEVSYLLGTKFRLKVLYNFTYRENTLNETGETALSHETSVEARYNIVSKSTLNAGVSFVKIDYTGSKNSAIEFAMLQGFQDGNNYTWTIAYERTLARAIQLSLGYDGRKTGELKSVHVGKVQVRAIF